MTKLFDTTLLGMELATPTVPYQNMPGSLHAEDGSFTFWSGGKCILAFPFENIQRWGQDLGRWTKDLTQKAMYLGVEALTLGFLDANRFAYNWIVYYDENIGGEVEIWLLASNGSFNRRELDRRHLLIAQYVADWRGRVRHNTQPR